jgi:hypothetical protein
LYLQQQPLEPTSPVRKQKLSSSPIKRRVSADKLRLVKDVPRFFWPEGKTPSKALIQDSLAKAEEKLKEVNNSVNYSKFGEVAKERFF